MFIILESNLNFEVDNIIWGDYNKSYKLRLCRNVGEKVMAHCNCINGHNMWNGDGKPTVWAFSVDYIKDMVKSYPNFIILCDDMEIYDLYNDENDLDCWYCDECKSLAVFVSHYRYDFIQFDVYKDIEVMSISQWEDYIALRDRPFEDFQIWYDGMDPISAIENYKFDYRYKVSPDKKTIYAIDFNNEIAFGFRQVRFIDFNKK